MYATRIQKSEENLKVAQLVTCCRSKTGEHLIQPCVLNNENIFYLHEVLLADGKNTLILNVIL